MVNKIIRVVQANIAMHTKLLTDKIQFKETKAIFRDKIDFLFIIGIISVDDWNKMLDKLYLTQTVVELKTVLSELALVLEDSKEEK